jgi:hypothetical protein
LSWHALPDKSPQLRNRSRHKVKSSIGARRGTSVAIDLIHHVARPIRTLDELMQEQQRLDRPREVFLAK